MRLTNILCRQHIGRSFKLHWLMQGKRTPIETHAEEYLVSKGFQVVDAKEFLDARLGINVKKPVEPVKLPGNWHDTKCAIYKDRNVLLLGLPQAQVLLSTLKLSGYPQKIEEAIQSINIPTAMDKAMQQSVINACLFDPEQEKGDIVKDPARPAHTFARVYGISYPRKNRLLFLKYLQHCEKLAGRDVSSHRRVLNNIFFKVPFIKDNSLVQFELHAETFITSRKPIPNISEAHRFNDLSIPDIFPVAHTASIPMTNTYDLGTIYPIQKTTEFVDPHTIMLHFSHHDVKNLHEIPVLDSQFESRAMLKSFAVAASKAKTVYGEAVKDLSQPIVVQSVQADGKRIQFGIFQLNTLNLDDSNTTKNHWYCTDIMNIYDECNYIRGKPVLEGYNKDILKHMLVFYNNS